MVHGSCGRPALALGFVAILAAGGCARVDSEPLPAGRGLIGTPAMRGADMPPGLSVPPPHVSMEGTTTLTGCLARGEGNTWLLIDATRQPRVDPALLSGIANPFNSDSGALLNRDPVLAGGETFALAADHHDLSKLAGHRVEIVATPKGDAPLAAGSEPHPEARPERRDPVGHPTQGVQEGYEARGETTQEPLSLFAVQSARDLAPQCETGAGGQVPDRSANPPGPSRDDQVKNPAAAKPSSPPHETPGRRQP